MTAEEMWKAYRRINQVEYRTLGAEEISRELFRYFERRQVVTDCLRKVDGKWVVKSVPFIDMWSEEEYEFLVKCLKRTVTTGGVVNAAFVNGKLKGFSSVEPELYGSKKEYVDLSCIHVSEEMRGKGIGKTLFGMDAKWARAHGAKKLYISAHSAVETQKFYHALGCVDALELDMGHVQAEPYDRQMEYAL